MIYAEWSGRTVTLLDQNRLRFRRINVNHPVVGVQVSGDSTSEATVAIAMDNGRTCLYKSSGQLIRQG